MVGEKQVGKATTPTHWIEDFFPHINNELYGVGPCEPRVVSDELTGPLGDYAGCS